MYYVISQDNDAEISIRTMNFERYTSFSEAVRQADKLKKDTKGLNYAVVHLDRVYTTQTLADLRKEGRF
jgi:hypothetical protein